MNTIYTNLSRYCLNVVLITLWKYLNAWLRSMEVLPDDETKSTFQYGTTFSLEIWGPKYSKLTKSGME
jgi:hypothetical protein